ncbi:hypothetical protein DBR47_16165 [Paucibacter sp. KBW04]|uniref:glutaredoxin family protein n=1 Tax=Paucibacter sp. KBW04 TaxID=2153361 RepID=UPI000F56F82A|nr:glutaredoxin family protein [Paucibacter sp. KBW04]RQO57354.1 hypothetical protein DBR47_16165 [Paucibacter sp. KBW04]
MDKTKGRSAKQFWPLLLIVLGVWSLSQAASWWLARSQAQTLRELAKPGDIRMISSTTCVFCEKARRWMTAQAVPFQECFIETDAACMSEYQARGARGTPTMVVRGQTQLGFDKQRVAQALKL